jgi:hypothetical protein
MGPFPSEVVMRSSHHSSLLFGTLAALLLAAGPAQASPIVPGQTISPVPFAGGCPCGGPFLADTAQLPWAIHSGLHGVYQSVVIDSDPGVGVALEFLYQIGVDEDSTSNIYRLIMSAFTGWATDVAYYDPGGGGTFVAPSSVNRDVSGATIRFEFFSPMILPGDRSYVVGIRTNATDYTRGTLEIIGGAVDRVTVNAFQPAGTPPAAVPEPASLLLLGTGVVALRRRFGRR